jgi:hypothetical protein
LNLVALIVLDREAASSPLGMQTGTTEILFSNHVCCERRGVPKPRAQPGLDLLLLDFHRSHGELFDAERVRRAPSSEIDAHVVRIEMRFDRVLRLLEAIDEDKARLASAKVRIESARGRLRAAIASTEIVIDLRVSEEPTSSTPFEWRLNVSVYVAAIDRIMTRLEPDVRELEAKLRARKRGRSSTT